MKGVLRRSRAILSQLRGYWQRWTMELQDGCPLGRSMPTFLCLCSPRPQISQTSGDKLLQVAVKSRWPINWMCWQVDYVLFASQHKRGIGRHLPWSSACPWPIVNYRPKCVVWRGLMNVAANKGAMRFYSAAAFHLLRNRNAPLT